MKTKICLTVLLCVNLIIGLYVFNMLRESYSDKPLISGWRRIYVESFGEIQIPEDWIFSTDGHMLLFTDKLLSDEDYEIYLIGTIQKSDTDNDMIMDNHSIKFIKNIESEKIMNTAIRYGTDLVKLDNTEVKMNYISLEGINSLKIYSMTPRADEGFLKQMAESCTYNKYLYEISCVVLLILLIADILILRYVNRKFTVKPTVHAVRKN